MNEEIWKIIEEFPTYCVSSLGRVKNNITNYILIGGYDKDGYKQVTLTYNSKQYNRRICRLVALAFIPNPDNLPQINHKDENKENDSVENLEWCTSKYNNVYGSRLSNVRKKVICIETGEIYDGIRLAARECGLTHSGIGRSCRKNVTCGGYHWKYMEEHEKKE